jgi:hypothetical protein
LQSHINDTWKLTSAILDSLYVDTDSQFIMWEFQGVILVRHAGCISSKNWGSVGHFGCKYNVSLPNLLNKLDKVQDSGTP